MQTLFRGTVVLLIHLMSFPASIHAQDPLPYTTYPTFDQIVEGSDAHYPALTRISEPAINDSRAYTGFFFYQALQFDPTGRYALGMKVSFEGREVEPDDRGEIGYVDLSQGNLWTKIGESTAWNWQQGCRLQWRPQSDEIIWNDRSDDGKQYVSRVYNVRTGTKRTLPRPIYDLSPDGISALTHDFDRYDIFFHGNKNLGKIQDQEFAPNRTGVWKMNLDTGEADLLVSLQQMATKIYPNGSPKTGFLYFFREGWNPSGTRFIAFLKAEGLNEAYSIAADGTDIRYLYRGPSHHAWRDDRNIFDFGTHTPPDGDTPQAGYYLFEDDGSGKPKQLLWAPTASGGKYDWNGHGSYLPGQNGNWIISDTYVDASGFQYLFLYHVPTELFVPLAKLKSTLAVDLDTDCCRVDTHPRFSRDGRLVCIDASIDGLGRQMYVIDIGHILDHPPTHAAVKADTKPFASSDKRGGVLKPEIDGPWWTVARSPDLGALSSPDQQPVDFAVWSAADGSWQICSCIRNTKCGGRTRLFYRWEGQRLTDSDWEPIGIAMQAEPKYGEMAGGLQAPHVVKNGEKFFMAYGDSENICMAESREGKQFQRMIQPNGQTGLFAEGSGNRTRDAMLIRIAYRWHCYHTAYPNDEGAVYCRTSDDLVHWSDSVKVAFGGQAGTGPLSAECPFVVAIGDRYYLFKTQRYGQDALTTVYHSTDPMDFGVNNDREHLVCTLPVAAPEIIFYEDQYYLAALRPDLKGIQIARLKWTPDATRSK